MPPKILCVDDDDCVLAGYQRNLRKQFPIDTALGGVQGLAKLDSDGPYSVVVADMQMPMMNGIEFLKQVEAKAPDTVRMMLTGNADQKTAVDAVNDGHVFRFLTKPCPPDTLAVALQAGIGQSSLVMAERELLTKTLNGSVKMLTDILSMMDPQSFGRAQRLRGHMQTVVRGLHLTDAWELELAAMLSSIGYLALPNKVIEKARAPNGLSGAERDVLARVPQVAFNLLANIPRLETVAKIIFYQNKNFDGSGFPPDRVQGENIPKGSRIIRVLLDLLLMESQRISKFQAFEKMRQCQGRYDPKVLDEIANCFGVDLRSEVPKGVTNRAIALNDLCVGHVIQSDVVTTDNNVIVSAGEELSQASLEKLRNFAELCGIKGPICVEA